MPGRPPERARALGRALLGHSYAASKQVALLRMARRHDAPTVVFSMGKTGSTAIARAVQDATGRPVFQVFRLEPTRLREAEQRYRARRAVLQRSAEGRGPDVDRPAVAFPGAYHLWESEFLVRHPPTAAAPWRIVTTVREPVAQAVSAFFHAERQSGAADAGDPGDPAVLADLTDRFVSEAWVRAPLRWFEREFRPAVGIDPLVHPFDPASGAAVIETPAARVLLLRQESFAVAPAALAAFLGTAAPVTVPRRNDGTAAPNAATYRRFLAEARLPTALLDEAYESPYAEHFYGKDEIARFRHRWSGE